MKRNLSFIKLKHLNIWISLSEKKFHEEPNITICSQVSDTWTGRAFFTPFVFFFELLDEVNVIHFLLFIQYGDALLWLISPQIWKTTLQHELQVSFTIKFAKVPSWLRCFVTIIIWFANTYIVYWYSIIFLNAVSWARCQIVTMTWHVSP